MGWLNRGFDGDHHEKARKEAASSRKTKRFWLQKDSEATIVFLDEEPVCLWEHILSHQQVVNGKSRWFTNEVVCRKGYPNDPVCPMCMSDVRRVYKGFLTVLDVDGWTDDNGVEHKNIRRLFPMNQDQMDMFREYKKRRDGLIGWKVAVFRSKGDKTPVIGTGFDFIERVDPFLEENYFYRSKLKDGLHPPEIYDYESIFTPPSGDEMVAIMQMHEAKKSGHSGGGYSGGREGGQGRYEDKYSNNRGGGDGDAVY
jgi:hypothetical protein